MIIDCHAHLTGEHTGITRIWGSSDSALIDAAERVGIGMSCASILTTAMPAPLEDFQECNRQLAAVIPDATPTAVRGYCYVNPGYTREALSEIRYYVEEQGFIGVKLYNEYKCTDPILFPIIELAIELGVPILASRRTSAPAGASTAQHLGQRRPRRAGSALPRSGADSRPHRGRR